VGSLWRRVAGPARTAGWARGFDGRGGYGPRSSSVSSEVAVYVAVGERDLLAGRLQPDDSGRAVASFGYDDGYLADPDAYPLDSELPLVPGELRPAEGRAAFGAFADSSPDGWGWSLIRRAELARAQEAGAQPSPIGFLDVLTGVRDDLRQGALRYAGGEGGPFLAAVTSAPPGLADLPGLLDLAERFEHDELGYADLELLVRAGGSIGGWRPKVHLVDAAGRAAIAKIPKAGWDSWDVMSWEKVAHDLARAAGISLPDSELIEVGDARVFIVTRFDRHAGGRVGYASARTMLNAAYGETRSYLDIAQVIEQHSPDTAADLRELWRRIAFSILISNTDDHLRNHGFLRQRGGSWALSPAFDLNPNPAPDPKQLSTAINLTDTTASVDTLMSVADRFGLDASGALAVLAEVTQAVAAWREVAVSHGLQQEDLDAMEPAFEHAETERARALTADLLGDLA
jgi:serine/threonine-protein kinase HipA